MNDILSRTAGALRVGDKRFRGTMMLDKSSSIQMRGLVRPLCAAADQIIAGIAAHRGSLLRLGLFDANYAILTGDRNPDGDIWGQFVPATELAQCSVAEHYVTGWGTSLDRYLSRELQVLIGSFDDDTRAEFLHVLFTITDGIDTAPQRDKRGREILQYMKQIKARAVGCGGITRSRIVPFYVGIGLTEAQHHEQAARYGYPSEWVVWFDGTAREVERAGDDVTHTVMDMGRGGHTVINPVRRPHRESDTPTPV